MIAIELYIRNYPFVLIFFSLVIILIPILIIIKNKIFKNLILSTISVLMAFMLVEIILSLFMPPYFSISKIKDVDSYFPFSVENKTVKKRIEVLLDNNERFFLKDKNYEKENKLFIKNQNNIVLKGVYTIDKNGCRYTKCDDNSKETCLFLGSSFMFGDWLNDNETLPYLFSEKLDFKKFKIINAGRQGWNINGAYSILSSDGLCLDNLLENTELKYVFYEYACEIFNYFMAPQNVMLCEDGILYEMRIPFRTIKKYFTRCLIYEKFFSDFIEKKSNTFYNEYIQKIFLKMYNITKQRYNAEFVVIMWNQNKTLENFFIRNNISFITAYEVLDYSKDTIKGDGHPNVNGNKKIAGLLIDYLKSKGEV